jgi:hypothetical protein
MAKGLTYKAQAIERALRSRGHISRDQSLRDWVIARQAERHSASTICSSIWAKTKGEMFVSERSLRNWFPDLFGKDAAASSVHGDPE